MQNEIIFIKNERIKSEEYFEIQLSKSSHTEWFLRMAHTEWAIRKYLI